jgi:hypothetical protein
MVGLNLEEWGDVTLEEGIHHSTEETETVAAGSATEDEHLQEVFVAKLTLALSVFGILGCHILFL